METSTLNYFGVTFVSVVLAIFLIISTAKFCDKLFKSPPFSAFASVIIVMWFAIMLIDAGRLELTEQVGSGKIEIVPVYHIEKGDTINTTYKLKNIEKDNN
jgi:uncharacterized membrane protein